MPTKAIAGQHVMTEKLWFLRLSGSRLILYAAAMGLMNLTVSANAAPDPWADNVESYTQGSNPFSGFLLPEAALGEPTRITNPMDPQGGAVTPFQPAFATDEIVSIGAGGQLTVSFDEPVTDDPLNPFGIDLIVFGNAFYIFNPGNQTATGGAFTEGGVIEVSAKGTDFFAVNGLFADDVFPTNGFLDPSRPRTTLGPGGGVAEGTLPTDFTLPVDPGFEVQAGDTLDDILDGYAGSGGGVGIDLASVGLSEVSFVRVSNPLGSIASPEIDGFADVAPIPEPTGLAVLGAMAGLALTRRRLWRHAGVSGR
ncbi:MAG: hypothetical protein AAF750_11045 [Planctomycetota bacterium]